MGSYMFLRFIFLSIYLLGLVSNSSGYNIYLDEDGGNATGVPSNTTNTTIAPTMLPNNSTTVAPTPAANNTTTPAPTNVTTPAPTPAPTTKAPVTTIAPTYASTPAPTSENKNKKKHHISFLRILGKTLGWMILILLSVVAFGAIMSNRYRIYYFLRGCYYTFINMECTQYILSKLHFRSNNVDSGLNTILFEDTGMTEGLLMREANE